MTTFSQHFAITHTNPDFDVNCLAVAAFDDLVHSQSFSLQHLYSNAVYLLCLQIGLKMPYKKTAVAASAADAQQDLLSIENVVKSIRKKQFTPISATSNDAIKRRIAKMTSRGWDVQTYVPYTHAHIHETYNMTRKFPLLWTVGRCRTLTDHSLCIFIP